jgi:hypothetical protein
MTVGIRLPSVAATPSRDRDKNLWDAKYGSETLGGMPANERRDGIDGAHGVGLVR